MEVMVNLKKDYQLYLVIHPLDHFNLLSMEE